MKNTNYINRLIHSNNLLLYLIITFIFVIITGKLWWEFKDIYAAIGCSIIIPFGVMILKEVIYNVFIVKSGISMDRLFSVGIGQILGIGTLLYLILW